MQPLAKPPRRSIVSSAAVIFLAFAPASFADAQELEEINILTSNDQSCSPYPQIVSDEFGFFAEEGLKVNLLTTNTVVPFVAFLANGEADLVMLKPGQVLHASNVGQPVSVIYEAYQGASDGIVVAESSDIKSLADLKGKTVGLSHESARLILAIALGTVGLSLDDVSAPVVGDSAPTVATAINDGSIVGYVAGNTEFAALIAAGVPVRNLTPIEISQMPGNSWTVWKPTLEEKRDRFQRFLRAWAKGQHSGIMDMKAVMSACRKRIPEQWEVAGRGEAIVNLSVYHTQVRRTLDYGELQRDVWENIQGPYVDFGEISQTIDIDTFLDSSFIEAANDFTTDDVKKVVKSWKESNKDILYN